MNINEIYRNRFLTSEDIEQPLTVLVERSTLERFGTGENAVQKVVLHFRDLDKTLPLNWTNAQTLARITGSEDYQNWVGTVIELFVDEGAAFMGSRGGIRLRAAPAGAGPRAEPATPF